MNRANSKASEKVTVLVFKENDAARTFQVPLQWISQLGILIGILFLLAFICSFLTIKYYRIASRSNPSHIRELEQELTDLQINLKNLENQAVEAPPHHLIASPLESNSVIPPSTTPSDSPGQHLLPSFVAFPHQSTTQIPDPETLPIHIQAETLTWHGQSLQIRFALQYSRQDHGNQEGKILILARGPESLWSYPNGTMNRVGSDTLLAPEKGEFFSVSRYREVKATFGPVDSHDAIQEVEIFLFRMDGHVLAYQKLSHIAELHPSTSNLHHEQENHNP